MKKINYSNITKINEIYLEKVYSDSLQKQWKKLYDILNLRNPNIYPENIKDILIADFFMENSALLKITSCYYCEMTYVFTYKADIYDKKKKKCLTWIIFLKKQNVLLLLYLYTILFHLVKYVIVE